MEFERFKPDCCDGNMKTTILIIILVLTAGTMDAQTVKEGLTSHRWEDRLVLVLTDDISNKTYQKQLEELYEEQEGLKDRRLVIYTILPDRYRSDQADHKEWEESSELYTTYKRSDASFEILLIGLDGSVKLRQDEFLPSNELFARIDRMPMRQAELERRDGGD